MASSNALILNFFLTTYMIFQVFLFTHFITRSPSLALQESHFFLIPVLPLFPVKIHGNQTRSPSDRLRCEREAVGGCGGGWTQGYLRAPKMGRWAHSSLGANHHGMEFRTVRSDAFYLMFTMQSDAIGRDPMRSDAC